MKYLLAIVLLFSFNQVMAGWAFLNGNLLLERCEAYLSDTGNVAKGNLCFGYVTGIADAHSLFVRWEGLEQKWCMPDNIEGAQLVRVVTKYLQERPEKLHHAADILAGNALVESFPCE